MFLAANLELHCVPYYNSFLPLHISKKQNYTYCGGMRFGLKDIKTAFFISIFQIL